MMHKSLPRSQAHVVGGWQGVRQQRGVALFVGLIFLVVLSLVAVFAMKGTLMEMHMVNNVGSHERAFEASETLRAVPVSLFDQNVFNRGWPNDKYGFNGDVPPDNFVFTLPDHMLDGASAGLRTVDASEAGRQVNLYELECRTDLGEADNTCQYDPDTWIHSAEKWNGADMHVSICPGGGITCSDADSADIYIRADGSVLVDGSGGAINAGYRGPGTSSAGGGVSMYFEIMSVGHADDGRAVTVAQYRQAVRN